jgi:hypothetical protein
VVAGSSPIASRLPFVTGPSSCRFLLGGLIVLLMAFPFLEGIARPLILSIPLTGIFVIGVMVTDSSRSDVRRAILLAAIQVAFSCLSLAEDGNLAWISATCALLATVALILFSTYCVMRYVLRARVITPDQIYAGISMYLMLGFAFGAIFYLIVTLDPLSFSANTPSTRETPDLMYFSFVTLATLGYGDITPRTNIARSLAILESIAGMLYIAIFMARLVSRVSSTRDPE